MAFIITIAALILLAYTAVFAVGMVNVIFILIRDLWSKFFGTL
jgi:hypothetical protein